MLVITNDMLYANTCVLIWNVPCLPGSFLGGISRLNCIHVLFFFLKKDAVYVVVTSLLIFTWFSKQKTLACVFWIQRGEILVISLIECINRRIKSKLSLIASSFRFSSLKCLPRKILLKTCISYIARVLQHSLIIFFLTKLSGRSIKKVSHHRRP